MTLLKLKMTFLEGLTKERTRIGIRCKVQSHMHAYACMCMNACKYTHGGVNVGV